MMKSEIQECIDALRRINVTVLIATNNVDKEFIGIVQQGSFNLKAYKSDFDLLIKHLWEEWNKCDE